MGKKGSGVGVAGLLCGAPGWSGTWGDHRLLGLQGLGLTTLGQQHRSQGHGLCLFEAAAAPASLEEQLCCWKLPGKQGGEADPSLASLLCMKLPVTYPEYVVVSRAGPEFFYFSEFCFSCH